MKVAIVGSRKLGMECYDVIPKYIPTGISEIISGGARGIDSVAAEYAKNNQIKLTEILPDYGTFDKAAPLIRNSQIVKLSDFVLVLWDGKSRGSMNVIMTCIKTNKPYKILIVENN